MTSAAGWVPPHPERTNWDVVVIGTGAGGATAGFNLARLGRSVLFLERGPLRLDRPAGENGAPPGGDGTAESGWWPDRVYRRMESVDVARPMPIGCGAGGSTAVFSMVMDRFRPVDLTPGCFARDVPASALPERWPIAYEELEPYYREAEALFRVRGSDDPLSDTRGALLDPPPPSETEAAIHDTLAGAGLHPYRLHYAREFIPGCTGCIGRLCPYPCRNDAARVCLLPALERYGARVVPDCRVVRLEVSGRVVREARCVWNGREIAIRGQLFVLALNAFATPALLLRSTCASAPDGLGNQSGMVGRHLMLHVSDLLVVRFDGFRGLLNGSLAHGIALNDFYVHDGMKLGNVHVHAASLPVELPVSGVAVFHTLVEDFPYPENRVLPKAESDAEIVWQYRYPEELRRRGARLIAAFSDALRPVCRVTPVQPTGGLNLTHACGTCRFGDDPRTSVLDRDNRIHDLDNAYVVDASCLPSSGGIHPSLTIVANSLRASAALARR